MRKIIAASFQCESNSGGALRPQKYDFEFFRGEDIFKKLVVKEVFTKRGMTVVPSVYANALPSGTVEPHIYRYYKDMILQTARENADAAGVYLYVHGSMEVEGIGSGELQLLKELRAVLPDALFALTMDLHANITAELGEYADIVCGYKTAPHVDQEESQMRAATALADCLEAGIRPTTAVVKIPMLVKGDTMLTAEEPLRSLEEETRRLEREADIYGANLFFGHCWVDAINTSASAVVSAKDPARAAALAAELANKLWDSRHEYRFHIEAESAEECVRRALEAKEKRVFITDSGDNTTAGAEGSNTEILGLFLRENPQKKVCVAGITDSELIEKYWDAADGAEVSLPLAGGAEGRIKAHGEILGWAKEIIGRSLAVSVGNVDAIFTEKRSAFIEKGNFDHAATDLEAYDVVVVKLGYLFEELKPYADRELFALTDGASAVELEKLHLKNIMRPMFPLEDFEWKAK